MTPIRTCLAAFALALAPLAVCAEEAAHVAEHDGIRALHGWTRATTRDTALVFVEIENNRQGPVTLTGLTTDIAADARLAGFRLSGRDAAYEELPAIVLDPGARIALEPEGAAFVLTGLRAPLLDGTHFDATLLFGDVTLPFEIEVLDANARQHGHAGHAH